MTGKYKIKIYTNTLYYEFEIKRNITIIQGFSATGKTTLLNKIRESYEIEDGPILECSVPCRILTNNDWKETIESSSNTIFFIDEGYKFTKNKIFTDLVQESDNYFVIVTRENLQSLPYSVEEIYGIKEYDYKDTVVRVHNQFTSLYTQDLRPAEMPDLVITEDRKAGHKFWKEVFAMYNIPCISAKGRSNIYNVLRENRGKRIFVIADGAAFGCEMERVYYQLRLNSKIKLFLPESFEWIILNSGLIHGDDIEAVLEHTEDYADSTQYPSWERFYTEYLVTKSANTLFSYKKEHLNSVYLKEENKTKILNNIPIKDITKPIDNVELIENYAISEDGKLLRETKTQETSFFKE